MILKIKLKCGEKCRDLIPFFHDLLKLLKEFYYFLNIKILEKRNNNKFICLKNFSDQIVNNFNL